MKLVTFGTDRDINLVIQFPVFIQPYTQQVLIVYQIETVPVLTVDQNWQPDPYMHSQIDIPYIALNSVTYITIRQLEHRTHKRIGYKFYCKELFVVKHMSRYSCESAIYCDLDPEVIKEICKFAFFYNQTDITPTVVDGGNEIILANWSNDKQIICNVNNDIPVKIPSHLYVLVNRSVLYNCGIEVENNFLLESLAACQDSNSKSVMYFMVNTAFINYQLENLTNSLDVLIITDKTPFQQTSPILLNSSTLILIY